MGNLHKSYYFFKEGRNNFQTSNPVWRSRIGRLKKAKEIYSLKIEFYE
jgi:hypothetical protein